MGRRATGPRFMMVAGLPGTQLLCARLAHCARRLLRVSVCPEFRDGDDAVRRQRMTTRSAGYAVFDSVVTGSRGGSRAVTVALPWPTGRVHAPAHPQRVPAVSSTTGAQSPSAASRRHARHRPPVGRLPRSVCPPSHRPAPAPSYARSGRAIVPPPDGEAAITSNTFSQLKGGAVRWMCISSR